MIMSYNSERDILIRMFEMSRDKGALQFSIKSYDGSEPKLQITRMFEKKDGLVGYSKMGRLDKEEVKFFLDHGNEILELISGVEDRERK